MNEQDFDNHAIEHYKNLIKTGLPNLKSIDVEFVGGKAIFNIQEGSHTKQEVEKVLDLIDKMTTDILNKQDVN